MSRPKLRVAWHWAAMGPYHFSRMRAVAADSRIDLTVIETTAVDDHEWVRSREDLPFRLITLSREMLDGALYRTTCREYMQALRDCAPDVIVESGYSEPHSRSVAWSYREANPTVRLLLWSETASFDHRRFGPIERLKSWIVGSFDGALVAGTPHQAYMEGLGMDEKRVRVVGGVVDNEYFRRCANQARETGGNISFELPSKYFLYVGRLIAVKNLLTLLRAYHLYRSLDIGMVHDLVLVGSGPLYGELRSLVKTLGLKGVHFAGARQIEELPTFYAFASCLVLPSTSEPWGLVVNEAMAAGIPVVVSQKCGSAPDLVVPGRTGYVFDPLSVEDLATQLGRIADDADGARCMGQEASRRVETVGLQQYAKNVVDHLSFCNNARGLSRKVPSLLRLETRIEQLLR